MRGALLLLMVFCCAASSLAEEKEKPDAHAGPDTGSVFLLRHVWMAARLGREEGLEPISSVRDHLAAERILAIVADPHVFFDVREKIAARVAAWPYGSGHEYLVKQFREHHANCGWTVLHFFTSLGIPALEPVFWEILEAQKDVPVDQIASPSRLAASIRAFEHYQEQHDEHLIEMIARYLDQKAPHVLRVSAVTTLGSLRHASSIPLLIPHVADGVIGRDIIGALYRLTGQDFGNEPEAWRAWLGTDGANAPLKMLSREQLTEHRASAPQPAPAEESFYGLAIRGKQILFVLDVSSSMRGEKLERLRGESTNLLSALQHRPRDLRYDFITFSMDVRSCAARPQLMPNDDASFDKALKFVDHLQVESGTSMNAAFEHLATKVLPANNVDTIYLLTDGAPTDADPVFHFDRVRGLHHRTMDLMNRVRMIHYWYQVRINTVFIKERPGSAAFPLVPAKFPPPPPPRPDPRRIQPAMLMRQFAELTSGQFTEPE